MSNRRAKFQAFWESQLRIDHDLPRGTLTIKYDRIYRKRILAFLNRIDKLQKKSDEPHPFTIILSDPYKKRTYDQEKLYRWLLEIQAKEMNGNQLGSSDQMVTPVELYEADIELWGEREQIITPAKNIYWYAQDYHHVEVYFDDGWHRYNKDIQTAINGLPPGEEMTIICTKGTSMLKTVEMANWIEGKMNQLAEDGLSLENSEDVKNYWESWRLFLNDEKIILHEEKIMTKAEYKTLQKSCEACGKYLAFGTDNYCGELSHIVGFGMGGDRSKEPYRNTTINQFHLCTECHREEWHLERGRDEKEFIKKFPHLEYKIKRAKRAKGEINGR